MQPNKHWTEEKEHNGALLGIRIMFFLYALGGKPLFEIILFPVMLVYYLANPKKRSYSSYFLSRVREYRRREQLPEKRYYVFRHFLSFAYMMLDKLLAWRGGFKLNKNVFATEECWNNLNDFSSGGKVMLCSHLGNIEVLRALQFSMKTTVVNAVVFTENSRQFSKIYKAIDPASSLNLITTQSFGPDTAIMLQEKICKGEVVAIVGDRISPQKGRDDQYRVTKGLFMGEMCEFPEGPFILSALLKCKVQLLFGLRNPDTGKLDIICENFAHPVELSRKNRREDLQKYVQMYASRLEYYAIRYPYQWFNFYDFFKRDKN
ncbi:MAG: hypothetical protein ACI4VX_03355 [Succinivibrionaceae bacterium]